jgi:hypothetical protein
MVADYGEFDPPWPSKADLLKGKSSKKRLKDAKRIILQLERELQLQRNLAMMRKTHANRP